MLGKSSFEQGMLLQPMASHCHVIRFAKAIELVLQTFKHLKDHLQQANDDSTTKRLDKEAYDMLCTFSSIKDTEFLKKGLLDLLGLLFVNCQMTKVSFLAECNKLI